MVILNIGTPVNFKQPFAIALNDHFRQRDSYPLLRFEYAEKKYRHQVTTKAKCKNSIK